MSFLDRRVPADREWIVIRDRKILWYNFIYLFDKYYDDFNDYCYEHLTDITPEQMHELIKRIEVHAPDKSSGHRQQKVDIYFRFKVACASAVLDRKDYQKKRKVA